MTDIIETTAGIRCQMCGVVNWPTAMACMNCTTTLDTRQARGMFAYPVAAPKSFSQKVARFFEVADYLLLVPAICGLLFSLVALGSAPWFTLIIIATFISGCYLLSGFFRHSRGRLSKEKVSLLWGATIVYNLIDLMMTLFLANSSREQFFYLFSLWPLLVIVLSALALSSERQQENFSAR